MNTFCHASKCFSAHIYSRLQFASIYNADQASVSFLNCLQLSLKVPCNSAASKYKPALTNKYYNGTYIQLPYTPTTHHTDSRQLILCHYSVGPQLILCHYSVGTQLILCHYSVGTQLILCHYRQCWHTAALLPLQCWWPVCSSAITVLVASLPKFNEN